MVVAIIIKWHRYYKSNKLTFSEFNQSSFWIPGRSITENRIHRSFIDFNVNHPIGLNQYNRNHHIYVTYNINLLLYAICVIQIRSIPTTIYSYKMST